MAPGPRFSTWLTDLLFPARCLGCGRYGAFLCSSCLAAASRLPSTWYPPELGEALVGWTAPFSFDGAIRQAVYALKYQGTKAVAAVLAGELVRHLRPLDCSAHYVVPVPLHPQRWRERGFNQADLLARPVAEALGLPLATDLVRRRLTPPQVGMSNAALRQENVRGAFGWMGPSLEGKSVLLVDDVSTTGATLDAAAAALIVGGAGAVWGLVVAKEL